MLPPMTHPYRGSALLSAAAVLVLALSACGGAQDDASQNGAEQDSAAQDGTGQNGQEQGDAAGADEAGGATIAVAELADQAGNSIGTVTLSEAGEGAVEVRAEVQELEPGFRGLSIHETGLCEPQSANEYGQVGDFFSAGGHLPGHPEEEAGVVDGEEAPEDLTQDPELPEDVEPEQQAEVYHPDHAGNLPNLLVTEDRTGELTVVTDRIDTDLLFDENGAAVIIHSQADNAANIPERYAPQGPDYETLTTGDSGSRTACGVLESP